MHKTIRLAAKLRSYYKFNAILANETTNNTESTNNLKSFVDQYSQKKIIQQNQKVGKNSKDIIERLY